MACIQASLLLLAAMLSVLLPCWSSVLATDNFADDRDERCSGKCSAAALEGVHLLFAFNLYHSTLSDAAAMQAAADTAVQPGVRTFDSAATERSPSGILRISELTRQFVVRSAREHQDASAPHERCGGHTPPLTANVLPDRFDPREGDNQELHARLALRRLIEVHIERWAAGTWMHPLLEWRGTEPGAVRLRLGASHGYVLRGNGRDALWPCAGESWRATRAASVVLVLDDAGDPSCNTSSPFFARDDRGGGGSQGSSTIWMTDPRGASAYSAPALIQMGADTHICGRIGEIWLVPPGVPLAFPPHRLPRSRVVLVAEVTVDSVYDAALLAFLGPGSGQHQPGKEGGAGGRTETGDDGKPRKAAADSSGIDDEKVAVVPHFGTFVHGVSESWRVWRGKQTAGDGRGDVSHHDDAVQRSLASAILVRMCVCVCARAPVFVLLVRVLTKRGEGRKGGLGAGEEMDTKAGYQGPWLASVHDTRMHVPGTSPRADTSAYAHDS